jgi:hypothetical protein
MQHKRGDDIQNLQIYTLLSVNLKEREILLDLHVDGRLILKVILMEFCVRECPGFNYCRIGENYNYRIS